MTTTTKKPATPYCGLCDGDHEPRRCPATAVIQRTERSAR